MSMVCVVVKQKVCLKMEAVNYGRLFIKMWKLKKIIINYKRNLYFHLFNGSNGSDAFTVHMFSVY